VVVEHVHELLDVFGELGRRDRRVFDERVRFRVALEAHQQRNGRLAELPEFRLVLLGVGLEALEGVALVDEVGVRPGDRLLEIVEEFGVDLQHQRRFRLVGDRFLVAGELL